MRTHVWFLLVAVSLSHLGCTSIPATSSQYEISITCEQDTTLSHPRSRISGLSGFSVGPTAQRIFKNLDAPTLRPFTSDGCSVSPDGSLKEPGVWVDCCVHHDVAYWIGGSRDDKMSADLKLEQCLDQKGYPKVGKIYRTFVERFGGQDSQQTYRWGYGWNYKRAYSALTLEEDLQIEALYKVRRDKIEKVLLAEQPPLIRMCETFDPIFYGISDEEKLIYAALNSSLKRDDTIIWAKYGPSDFGRRTFLLKLRHCPSDVEVTVETRDPSRPIVRSSCE